MWLKLKIIVQINQYPTSRPKIKHDEGCKHPQNKKIKLKKMKKRWIFFFTKGENMWFLQGHLRLKPTIIHPKPTKRKISEPVYKKINEISTLCLLLFLFKQI